MRQRKKRSAAITLVLAGTLSGCSEPIPQQDVYRSLADCQRDWGGQASQCQPVRDGRYAPSYYYGPTHYGSSLTDGRPRPSRNAMDAVRAPGKPVGTGSTTVARSGFGSSARSFSSGS